MPVDVRNSHPPIVPVGGEHPLFCRASHRAFEVFGVNYFFQLSSPTNSPLSPSSPNSLFLLFLPGCVGPLSLKLSDFDSLSPRALARLSQMSLFASGASASAGQANTTGDISKDVTLNHPPEDSISDLRFSPTSDHLAVASWDKKVRIYEINDQGQSEGKALFEHEGPVLNCAWSPVSRYRFFFFPTLRGDGHPRLTAPALF